jgi:hypothetical protein
VSFFVGFNIRDILKRVSSDILGAIERGFPKLQLTKIFVEDNRLDMTCQEEAKGQDKQEDYHQILPPMPGI